MISLFPCTVIHIVSYSSPFVTLKCRAFSTSHDQVYVSLWASDDLDKLQWRLAGSQSGQPDGIIQITDILQVRNTIHHGRMFLCPCSSTSFELTSTGCASHQATWRKVVFFENGRANYDTGSWITCYPRQVGPHFKNSCRMLVVEVLSNLSVHEGLGWCSG